MRWLALALALLGTSATAQPSTLLPGVSGDDREQFRVCRAAIFHHLADGAQSRTVPVALAEALREQVTFIMHETLRRSPGGSLREAEETIAFAENFFISFTLTLREHGDLAADVPARERILIGCVPMLWRVTTTYLDSLMTSREAAEGR